MGSWGGLTLENSYDISGDQKNYQLSVLRNFAYSSQFPKPFDITELDAVLMAVHDDLQLKGYSVQSTEEFVNKRQKNIDNLSPAILAIDERDLYEGSKLLYTYNEDPDVIRIEYAAKIAVDLLSLRGHKRCRKSEDKLIGSVM